MTGTPDPPKRSEEDLQADLSLAPFEAMADEWAAEVDLTSMIKNATSPMLLNRSAPLAVREKFKARMEAQIDAIARQSFIEGIVRFIHGKPDERE